MVVGWSMGPRMAAELADDALKMAIARRNPPEGCIHHSDSKNVHSRFAAACWRPYPASRDRIAAS